MQPRRRPSVDGFARQPAGHATPAQLHPRPVEAAKHRPVPARPAPAPVRSTSAEQEPKPRKRTFAPPASTAGPARASLWERLQLPVTIVVGLCVGFFMQSLLFGLAIIALYGLAAVIWKVQSRVTFVLAFLSLVAVLLLLLVKRNPEQSGNFATYTFLLLVIAVVSLAIESRQAKPHYKKR